MKKKQFLTLLILSVSFFLSAQSQDAFQYQALIRDQNGTIVSNKNVSVRFKIHQSTATGSILFIENHSITTNLYGIVSLKIGRGTSEYGTLSQIKWVNGPFFIETEVNRGEGYVSTGTQQLLSVPFAKYANNTNNVQLKSPNGKLWNIVVNDNGSISAVEIVQ